MVVVLVGAGGREHALAWRLAQAPSLSRLVVTGHNPGWPDRAELRPASSTGGVVDIASELRADLVVVGPEGPLAQGLSDALWEASIPCFGPSQQAARLETSKAFAKEIMELAGVPTAGALVIDPASATDRERALQRCRRGNVVLKADGLAAGKGVVVCPTAEEAVEAFHGMSRFGEAARKLVLEDLLAGPEVSLFALSDGDRVVPLPSAQDHKRLLDGGLGPNTGGMGAYAPCPLVDEVQARELVQKIHLPVIREMARRGTPFRGVLYAGLMLTEQGPYVLEFNVRFGDPECQPLMMLWQDDPLPWLHGAANGRLPAGEPAFSKDSACCVVLAAPGYPDEPQKGAIIPEIPAEPHTAVFLAGTERGPDGRLRASGGRVLSVTATGPTLAEARARAYALVPRWRFEGAQLRADIGSGTG
jgi:phosphoribosylamine--glycine ligase